MTTTVCLLAVGCLARPVPLNNSTPGPLYVPAADSTVVWERLVDVVHDLHFNIAREDRVEGVIETEYKPGASLFEPWHQDSATAAQRLESTLQSIRRRIVITFQPTGDGGNMINVRVDKEIEDLPGVAANSAGDATFQENQTLQRDLDNVVGQSQPSMWIPRGRDLDLERVVNARIRAALTR